MEKKETEDRQMGRTISDGGFPFVLHHVVLKRTPSARGEGGVGGCSRAPTSDPISTFLISVFTNPLNWLERAAFECANVVRRVHVSRSRGQQAENPSGVGGAKQSASVLKADAW